MKQEMFDELVESVREGGEILRGKIKPSRFFAIKAPDIKRIRTSWTAPLFTLGKMASRRLRTYGDGTLPSVKSGAVQLAIYCRKPNSPP